MRRGNFVTVAMPGDFGKPRPALIVQGDDFIIVPTIVICPLTSTLRTDTNRFRITVYPTAQNGLHEVSQVAVDKIGTTLREKVGQIVGMADAELMTRVNHALAIFLGIV